ncbi:54S ribosomal protein L31 [Colletotrichum cuscutae]|uniref:54S ribosomal protein L31 n=1 Tax=Colletotrichum cuscutae TaxID=1209917 RepID=A0AAI9Y447_9PEZI|nr:54S ribosomal protein L31 [Colletotrichum cuscutae]
MFGAFRMTSPLSSGLLWKIPWRLSKFQKRRHRERLRAVDDVIATVDAALAKKGETVAALELVLTGICYCCLRFDDAYCVWLL